VKRWATWRRYSAYWLLPSLAWYWAAAGKNFWYYEVANWVCVAGTVT